MITDEQEKLIAEKIKEYLGLNLEIEIGNIDARALVSFLSEQVGKFYYNKGILDSLTVMESKIEDLYSIMKDE